MASKFGMAGGIPERRVRPIWDAVDTRQFKTSLKLSTALLSKYPNSPYAIVSFYTNSLIPLWIPLDHLHFSALILVIDWLKFEIRSVIWDLDSFYIQFIADQSVSLVILPVFALCIEAEYNSSLLVLNRSSRFSSNGSHLYFLFVYGRLLKPSFWKEWVNLMKHFRSA